MDRGRWGLQVPVVVSLSKYEQRYLSGRQCADVSHIHLSGWQFVGLSETVRELGIYDEKSRRWWCRVGSTLELVIIPSFVLNFQTVQTEGDSPSTPSTPPIPPIPPIPPNKFRRIFLLTIPGGKKFFLLERAEWSTGTLWLEAIPVEKQKPIDAQDLEWAKTK